MAFRGLLRQQSRYFPMIFDLITSVTGTRSWMRSSESGTQIGTRMERKWNANGTQMEREWNANESLRHSLMQINLEKINGASSVEQSPLNHSQQINTYNTKAPEEALNKENTDQIVKTAKATNKINTRSKTDRHQGPINNPAESYNMAPEVVVSVSPIQHCPVSRSLKWIGKLPLIETSKSTSRPPKTSEKPATKTPGTSEWIGKLPLIEASKSTSQPPFLKHRRNHRPPRYRPRRQTEGWLNWLDVVRRITTNILD